MNPVLAEAERQLYGIETSVPLSMQKLILKQANKNRLGAIDRSPNDFDVLDADRCTRLTA
jgi:hypothetical protein